MKSLFVEDVVAQAFICALDSKLYDKFDPFVQKLTKMDHHISLITKLFSDHMDETKRTKVLDDLGEWHEKAVAFFDDARPKFGTMMPSGS